MPHSCLSPQLCQFQLSSCYRNVNHIRDPRGERLYFLAFQSLSSGRHFRRRLVWILSKPTRICHIKDFKPWKKMSETHSTSMSKPPSLPNIKVCHICFRLFPKTSNLTDTLESYFYPPVGAPGWLSRLSDWLRLRSRSHSSWVRAPRRALCWQLRAWSLLRILCLPPFLPLPCSCSLSVPKINKCWKKLKKKINKIKCISSK